MRPPGWACSGSSARRRVSPALLVALLAAATLQGALCLASNALVTANAAHFLLDAATEPPADVAPWQPLSAACFI